MTAKKQAEATYTKAQFLASKQFTPAQKDVLRALMPDGESLTVDQAQKLISDYAKRKVI
ncbi:hypothetical protein [Cohnella thailandensis]|uniref:Uncharacterized protein n=1 Tax=Cohnella thailandensis TaxID=557557 RepID=A0A841SNK1_9BACL|nr:hypothetical protein [Cohnella thailandensis]MBB6632762.1 hypothetical protein [Cohnella thailandensis]MBP1975549.1 hypothetical protein [Cohnella thailandensis]